MIQVITPREFKDAVPPHRKHIRKHVLFTGEDGLKYRMINPKKGSDVYAKGTKEEWWELMDFMKKHRIGTHLALKMLKRNEILESL